MRADKFIRKGLMTMRHLFRPAKPDEHEPPSIHNPFLDLPPELILSVADSLDQESKVLLSLSCKYLRLVLNTHLDLSLCDLVLRTNFLRYLEIDHPEFLTCRTCGWMFHWRKLRCVSYQCPRSMNHPIEARRAIGRTVVCWWDFIFMRQELLDLVLREHRRGPSHGIPLYFLNSNALVRTEHRLRIMYPAINEMRLQTQARMVDGRLMLFSCWTIDLNSTETLERDLNVFNNALCEHYWDILADGLWRILLLKTSNAEDIEQSILHKCSFCATDYKIHLQKLELAQLRIVLKAWRNFGNGYSDSQDVEQIFRRSHELRIDADTLSRRDLEATFISKEGMTEFTTSCQHRECTDPRMIDED